MTTSTVRRTLVTAAALAALAPVLAACGSSADDASSTTAAAGAATTAAAGMRDRAELQACLRQQGVELPQMPAGAGRPPQGGTGTTPAGPPADGEMPAGPPPGADGSGGPGPGGGFRDLSDADRRRMQAALEKCGATFGGGFGGPGGPGDRGGRGGRPDTAALRRFVACVRRNGYDLPDANTSGDGPVFDDRAVDRDDPAFVKASRACQRYLAPSS
ncbi:hypothetical protein Q5424_03640 [Conexibacter sp. JD483]|uniref:hypothetical protein n=1 Tax=unclassified Conexibacter TaxID=2627773 RepID=UPI002728D557|nr:MULTISPECIES: hypothetical protein [unclassified Conexibacter]MDO8186182.1 hypothetical protein [Conexibacter sp. CPCC 205706]MDO8199751.1 hypothetical protein [Conexibacter sp. CPCC 205762]MDR9368157.1 hypothetical protein [Conexibacter sp. JD483]